LRQAKRLQLPEPIPRRYAGLFPHHWEKPLTVVVLYHQPDKMLKAANDLAERQENLEKLKKQHGID
jgi:hypothetical protein